MKDDIRGDSETQCTSAPWRLTFNLRFGVIRISTANDPALLIQSRRLPMTVGHFLCKSFVLSVIYSKDMKATWMTMIRTVIA